MLAASPHATHPAEPAASSANHAHPVDWERGGNLTPRPPHATQRTARENQRGVERPANYKYDVGGNLIERSVDLDGAGAGSPVVTKHAYDENGNAWADLTAGGSLTTRRIYADAVDALMARIGSSNDEDWYLTDLLGSVRDIADSTGAGINHLDYNTFGGVATETSPTDGDRYAWTGRERDAETQLQYNRARWYDPATKRWLSQDPMGFDAGDSNLYRYATNSAASSTDPSGKDDITFGRVWDVIFSVDTLWWLIGYEPDGYGGHQATRGGSAHSQFFRDQARNVELAIPQTRVATMFGGAYDLAHQGLGNLTDLRKGK
jgi:RHS repeat-associated protein